MQIKFFNTGVSVLAIATLIFMSSCGGSKGSSSTTGWDYNSEDWGGFEKTELVEQETGPGLVLIEGGRFSMGEVGEDVVFENHAPRRTVTVASFYMDQSEVRNIDYREYTYWLERVYGEVYPEYVASSSPDKFVWREELSYNEPYVQTYFEHPAYNDYPVVGVSWEQANEYCKWRTDRVNEKLLVEKGYLELDLNQAGEEHFNTESYLVGQYEGIVPAKGGKKNLDPTGEETRSVKFEDGVLLPDYRLPTEAEWEYAALALAGEQDQKGEERYVENRIYPWSGMSVRNQERGKGMGDMMANFQRGRGDMMGVAGALNDNALITAPVDAYPPNDFGLYNMAGNVSEWVQDVFRPVSHLDVEDFNPFRGNIFETQDLDEEGLPQRDSLGRIKYREYTQEEIGDRENYRASNVVDYEDGDENSEVKYDTNNSTLISNTLRVIKGGSWRDRAYWLRPGTRRSMEQEKSSATIGFRCAMIRVGSQGGK